MNFLADSMKVISIAVFSIAALLLACNFLNELGWIHIKPKRFLSSWISAPIGMQEDRDPAVPASVRQIRNKEVRLFIKIALYCVFSRFILALLGYMIQMLVNEQGGNIFSTLESNWNHWDSPHYIDLAEHWYTNTGESALFIVFYPLYPFLVKFAATILFLKNYFVAGVIVSNVCLMFAGYYLYKLVAFELGEEFSAASVKFILIFPFSFFFGIVYTESLFLLVTIMFFYYMRKGDWLLAGLSGLFAALSKNQALLLLVPAFIECIFRLKSSEVFKSRQSGKIAAFVFKNAFYILLIPLGSFLYLLLNKIILGNWFAFLEAQKSFWHNGFGFFADTVKYLVTNSFTWKPSETISLWIPQVMTFIFIAVLMFYSFRKLRLSYTAYIFFYSLITFSPTWLLSSSRYIAALFPIYMLLGIAAKNKTADRLLSYSFILFLSFYSMAFVLYKYVM